ncbi:sodium/proline symporter [Chakrabartyella piscis]|uniref:sodium/proline symporter n=1 Tax=Chakrabartyella piscis TaxID=2918914 RepID=UPI00295876C8|nr:sodium/proline symporter [Chakrabartyella piscis]
MNVIIICLLLYFVGMFAIAYASSKQIKTAEDYMVGGGKLGVWITAIATQSAAMSGFMFLGFASSAASNGTGAIWTAIASGTAPFICFAILARRMSTYTQKKKPRSFIDLLETRYYDQDKKYIRTLCSVIMFVCISVYIGSQILGAGKTFQYVLGLDYNVAVILATVIVVIYTSAGGLLAVAWTDFVQGMLMIFGIAVGLYIAFSEFHSYSGIVEAVGLVNPGKETPFWMQPWTIVGLLSAGGIAYCGQPHIVQMFMGMKSPDDSKKGMIISGFTGVFLLMGGFVVMLAAGVLFPESPDAELNYLMMVQAYLPNVLMGIVVAAVLSAIMSSTDALLHSANTTLVNDFYNGVLKKGTATDKELLFFGRIAAIVIGIIAILIALFPFEGFLWIMWWAFGGLSVFAPVVILGLHWKRATREGAIAALIIGFIATIWWFGMGYYSSVHLCVPAITVTTIVHVIVSLMTPAPPQEVQDDIESLKVQK